MKKTIKFEPCKDSDKKWNELSKNYYINKK